MVTILIGLQLFIIVFNILSFYTLSVLKFNLIGYGINSSTFIGILGKDALVMAPIVLLLSSLLLSLNVFTDVFILKRTRVRVNRKII